MSNENKTVEEVMRAAAPQAYNPLLVFRGKRIDNREWVYGHLLVDKNGKCHIYEYSNFKTGTNSFYNVDPETVSQNTGIKDKRGLDIYQHDFIRNTQAECNLVYWWGTGWHYTNFHAGALDLMDHCPCQPDVDWTNSTHEIIGNKFDNENLMYLIEG